MTTDVFWDLAARVGLPFAMVVLALLTGKGGLWVWKREMDRLEADHEEAIKDLRQQLADARQDRNYYRDIAFRALDRAEGAVSIADKATRMAERRAP